MALRTGLVHPTVNYDDPDPACDLPGISAETQERPLRSALLNAFGFGSNNAAVVFTQPPRKDARVSHARPLTSNAIRVNRNGRASWLLSRRLPSRSGPRSRST